MIYYFKIKLGGIICTGKSKTKKTLKKINNILRDIVRDPYNGIGKPEPLKDDLSGFWSRRIDDSNRLVYRINNDVIEILACRGHYN